MRRLLFLGVLALLVFPSDAFAHATLLKTTPQFRERLSASPPTVVLRFDQYVKVLPQSVQLFSATHPLHVKRIWADGLAVKAALPQLPRGPYTIRWHALSGDGHVVSGVFTFGVRANAPPPTEVTRSLHHDRGVGYPPVRSRGAWPLLAALLLLGAVGGAVLAYLLTRGDGAAPTVVTRVQRVTTQGRITTVEKQVTVTTTAASTSAAPAASSGASGAALNDAGFRKMQAGDYAGALPLLERAVQRLQGTNSLTEAYADYNLASTRVHLGSCDGVLELLDRSESIQGQRDPIDQLREQC